VEFYSEGFLKSLKFNSHIEWDPSKAGYSTMTVIIPEIAGIVLPEKPGWHTYRFSTQAEPVEISAQTEIVKSKIGEPTGKPEVHLEPPTPGTEAKYVIGFNVGRGGWLKEVIGLISIRFPKETQFNLVEIPAEWVKVNGITPYSQPMISTKTKQISIMTPMEIQDTGRVTVEFDSRCGIINPSKIGKYQIEVSTSSDREWVESYEYEITEDSTLFRLSNYKLNHHAVYQLIYLQQTDILKQGELIRVKFPDEVQISSPLSLETGKITINDQPIAELREIESHVYDLLVGNRGVNPEERVDIQFDCPEIKNPVKPFYIHLEYKPPGADDYRMTPSVAIVPYSMEITDIKVSPPNIRANATYTIQVIFGEVSPKTISIYFGHSNSTMEILNTEAQTDTYTITLYDINNGTQPGTFLLRVFTDLEKDGAVCSYYLFPPVPTTKISRKGRRGENEWWLSSPEFTLTSSDPDAEILYWWNDQFNEKKVYTGPFRYPDPNPPTPGPLTPGHFKVRLHYQSRNVNGSEQPNTEEIWVDTISPEIVIESPPEENLQMNQKHFTVTGRQTYCKTIQYGEEKLIFDAIVTINQEIVDTDKETGIFSKTFELVEGKNHFKFHAEDEAGNVWDAERTIILDTIMPDITLDPRLALDPFITGKTEPTALLTINGEAVYVEEDGSFHYAIHGVGLHELTLVAADPAGNVNTIKWTCWFGYTITLQIGIFEASTNGVNVILNVAPLIQKSKTLVPFRFIGEQLNATISYTTDPKTKLVKTVSYTLDKTTIILTIGAKNASVNGKAIPLDVPAQIMKGTTMVPLRFIAENLNCKVEWESKAQLITITYPSA
ncbi:MAG: stalk domain-containing protein, partial [Caldisericia bacterium]|nr:stalk domain-containing protein [Caldisericia bacterium]